MPKSAKSFIERAKIAPASKLSPETWMTIRKVTPWVTLPVATSLAWYSPIAALTTLGAGGILYSISDLWTPKLVFENDGKEPVIDLGIDEYGLPLTIPVKALLRHTLLIGTTGSGKTTTIRTIGESIMKLGGGFCFIDGKADVTDTYAILYEIVRNTDREEDLLVLNFLNPSQSHTLNFLLHGDADFLAEILTGFMPDAQGDQQYWQGKAKVLMKTLLTALVYMRDHHDIFPEFKMTLTELRKFLGIHAIMDLAEDERIPLEEEGTGRPIRQRIINYLNELGPWQELRKGRPSPAAQEIIRQHGFYVQQWTEPLDLVSGTFGPIFNTEDPDVDIVDVVMNSRILVVLLPSLSYSLSTLRGLGRMVLNLFKIALTTALGKDVEGEYKEIEKNVKRNRPSVPFTLIADEYGSYAIEGMDTILAQARSLGMAVIISVQELASLFKASETDAKRLIGNTNIKLIMKIEDQDTAEYIAKRAGEAFYLMPQASSEPNLILGDQVGFWRGDWQAQRLYRIEQRDLTSLKIGEGYIIYGDEVRKYKTRYIPPKKGFKYLRLVRYIKKTSKFIQEKVEEATQKMLHKVNKHLVGVYELMRKYAISFREESLYRQYLNARRKYILEEWDFSSDREISLKELVESGYLQISSDDLEILKDVIKKREKYENFKQQLWKKVLEDKNFFNFVLQPSEDAIQFVEAVLKEAVQS